VDVQETEAGLDIVRDRAVTAGLEVAGAAREGAAEDALSALARFRLLCAHRRGPYGVGDWTSRIKGWLAADIEDLEQRDYVGRPLLVTENDYELGLFNGDTGVIVAGSGSGSRATAAFERGNELLHFSPLRLGAVETVYAMTVHKSQGSQFDTAAVLLPAASSRILTRERAPVHRGHAGAARVDPGRERGCGAVRGGAARGARVRSGRPAALGSAMELVAEFDEWPGAARRRQNRQ
jgi:exodeoxyribonuclease V alpha subunit